MNYIVGQVYKERVSRIYDTGKVFTGGGIQKKKILITFEDSYEAEFCPPSMQLLNFKEGEVISFKVLYRNNKGDEIEVLQGESGGVPIRPFIGSTSMVGHPAAIALMVAKDMAIQNGWDWEKMLDKADGALAWLESHRDA